MIPEAEGSTDLVSNSSFSMLLPSLSPYKRCIDHSMHRAAYHFLNALHIPSLMKMKRAFRAGEESKNGEEEEDDDDDDDDEDDEDVDVSTNIEALADDVMAMASTTVTDFEPGDVLGKLLTLVNQVHMSSEGVCDYL